MKKNILVSIIITNYNKDKFIEKTINSALNQEYINKEVIIFDDGSTDKSMKIIKKFKNIKLIKNKKERKISGPLSQIKGIINSFKASKGEVIFLLDGDDEFKNTKLKSIINYFKNNKSINIIQDKPYIKKQKKNMKLKKKLHIFSIWPSIYPTSSIALRRKFFTKFLKYIEKNKYPNLEIDSRLVIYAFLKKNLKVINKSFTIYNVDQFGITSNYKKFSKNWWIKRKEAFDYMEYLMKKLKLKINKGPDFYFTQLVNLFY